MICLLDHPLSPSVSSTGDTHTGRQRKRNSLLTGKERGEGGGRVAELYDCKKALSSINNSILSGRGYCRLCGGIAEYSFSYRHSDKTLISCLLYIYIHRMFTIVDKGSSRGSFVQEHPRRRVVEFVWARERWRAEGKCAQPSSTMPRHPSGPPTTRWCRRRRAARRRRRSSPFSQFGLPRYLHGDDPNIQLDEKRIK